MRNMSFALTTDQVLAQTKTVTRRNGWLFLKKGDRVQPVRKAQGLKAGEHVQPIGPPIRITNVWRERLHELTDDLEYGLAECRHEGFEPPHALSEPSQFVAFFCRTHTGCTPETLVTRIQFEYEPAP